jgi:opacity protein-like surface antigen
VDVKFSRWVQLEAEGRWLRFNQYGGISQDNYLIGPRIPVFHFLRSSVYAKALGGGAKMKFGSLYGEPVGNGTFTALAFGGGMDVKLTKRISIRAVDFEYQYYPLWGNSTLSPYGARMGIGYKIF